MRKALIVATDVLLVLFLLATIASVALDLFLVRPGDTNISFVKGVNHTVTNMAVEGANVPPGSLALLQRVQAGDAAIGDALVCFDSDGRTFSGVLAERREGELILYAGGQMRAVPAEAVQARYRYVLPGGYDAIEQASAPWIVGSVGGAIFLMFIVARVIGARRREGPLSRTDGEISSLFR